MFMKNKTYDGVDGVELEEIWIVSSSFGRAPGGQQFTANLPKEDYCFLWHLITLFERLFSL